MLRLVFLVLLLNFFSAPAGAEDFPRTPPRPLASAFDAMQAGRWEVAAALAARAGPVARDLIAWHRLRAGRGTPGEVLEFLDRNGDWPGLDYLRKQSEAAMAGAGTDDILAFYANYRPQTGTGALSHARALAARGQAGEAEAGLVLAWRTLDLTAAEHEAFLADHGALLAPHHAARLDMALWRGLKDVALMLPLVSETGRTRAGIRQMIEMSKPGTAARIAELTEAQRTDPGIAYALFNRYLRDGKTDEATQLLLRQSRIRGGLGEPARWAGWRRALARARMRAGDAALAYEIASVHQLPAGAGYADLEWLSGYLALAYLDAPDVALDHFRRLRAAVATPISRGRAGYWIGRAREAMGAHVAAAAAYGDAARYQTSFYGLLAAERAGLAADPALSGATEPPDWRGAAFAQSSVNRAGVLALAAGRLSLAERFFVHLSQSQDREGLRHMAAMLEALGQPHLQVMLGKAAARRGLVLPGPYYALHPLAEMELPVPAELVLAIARRESEFDTGVVSGAGARGLMQLMPGTARDVARDLGLDHDRRRLLGDWRHNARLGATYLAQLSGRFGGNVIMIAAGYNAGPRRQERWMERFGDPRRDTRAMVDWIEHIPFRETRNYVMRVAESIPVYRARLGRPALPVPFSRMLTGSLNDF